MEQQKRKRASDRYEDLFLAFAGKVEKGLAAALIVLLIFLAVSQLLLQFPALRYLMVKVEQLEGNRYDSRLVHASRN